MALVTKTVTVQVPDTSVTLKGTTNVSATFNIIPSPESTGIPDDAEIKKILIHFIIPDVNVINQTSIGYGDQIVTDPNTVREYKRYEQSSTVYTFSQVSNWTASIGVKGKKNNQKYSVDITNISTDITYEYEESGTEPTSTNIFVKQSGAYKEVIKAYIKKNGIYVEATKEELSSLTGKYKY